MNLTFAFYSSGATMINISLATASTGDLLRLKKSLSSMGYHIKVAHSGGQVWQSLLKEHAEGVILDMSANTEEFDSFRLCSELNAAGVLVIALTPPGRSKERLWALRNHVFQCLTLPVSAAELAVSLEQALQQDKRSSPGTAPASTANYRDSILEINLESRSLRRAGRLQFFSPLETTILRLLLENTGRIIQRQELERQVWPDAQPEVADSRLKIYISMLRQKIEPDPRRPRYIVSHRRVGYGFFPAVEPSAEREPEPSAPPLGSGISEPERADDEPEGSEGGS